MSISRAHGGASAAQGRWASLGRTFGSAVGAIQRLLVIQRPGIAGKQAALFRLTGMRRRLVSDVAELEAQLERLHTTITNNPMSQSGEAGRSNLESLIRRARRVRQQIREKRDTLARVERHIARERWLVTDNPRTRETRQEPRGPARGARKRTRQSSKLSSIVERSPFQNRTQRATIRRLAEDLSKPGVETRHAACQKLSKFRVPAARKLLLMALDDSSERVQLAALNALTGVRGRGAARAFRRFISHQNPALRLAALRGLTGAGRDFVTRAELTRALSDDDPAVRKFALRVLAWRRDGEVPHSKAMPELALAIHDDDVAVRLGAVEALAATGSDRAVAPLIRALADEAEKVRDAASTAIVDIVGPEATEVGAGLPPEERVAALKEWWVTARVDIAMRRSGRPDRVVAPPAGEAPHVGPAPPKAAARAAEAPPGRAPARRDETPPMEPGADALENVPEAGIPEELAARVAAAEAEAGPDVASPGELDAAPEQADFESVFGEESTAVAITGLEPEQSAEQFESVFGGEESPAEEAAPAEEQKPGNKAEADESAEEDESAEAEEYENVFGSEEG